MDLFVRKSGDHKALLLSCMTLNFNEWREKKEKGGRFGHKNDENKKAKEVPGKRQL